MQNARAVTLPDEIMTLEEVARYLKIPEATLYAWRTRAKGPKGVRVGRHVRYRRRDVDAWLDAQAVA